MWKLERHENPVANLTVKSKLNDSNEFKIMIKSMFKEIKENTSKILNGLQEDINKQLN